MTELVARSAAIPRDVSRIVVLQRGDSPTADIYISERLMGAGVPVQSVNIDKPIREGAASLFPDKAFVIIVRYVNRRLIRMLRRRRDALAGVAYLMDDDIPGALASPDLPRPYMRKLAWFWAMHGRAIATLCSEMWFASEGLWRRYGGHPGTFRIDPIYLEARQPRAAVTVFYHGQISHRAEVLWLKDVISTIQAQRSDTIFEIFGRNVVKRAFRGIPRCRVVHRMSWSDYRVYTSAVRYDIGLAPLGSGRFNAGRSFNKLYDITRCGAVGVYAREGPYAAVIEDGVSGLLRDQRKGDWVEAINLLCDSPALRSQMHETAVGLARQLSTRELKHPLFERFRGWRAPLLGQIASEDRGPDAMASTGEAQ